MPNDRILNIPQNMSLEALLWAEPDEPLGDLDAFAKLQDEGTPDQLRWLAQWVEPQATVDQIIKHHGHDGLAKVLEGIARGCSAKGVSAPSRITAIAGFYGLEIH